MSFILAAARPANDPDLRLIAYLYYGGLAQPHREVWRLPDLDTGREALRRAFAENARAFSAELWQEDMLVARLRRPDRK